MQKREEFVHGSVLSGGSRANKEHFKRPGKEVTYDLVQLFLKGRGGILMAKFSFEIKGTTEDAVGGKLIAFRGSF